MRLIKDLKTNINRGTRHFIKNMVLLYASDMLRMCRTTYGKIKLDVTDDSIVEDLKYILENSVGIFTTRVTNNLNGSHAKVKYVKLMIERHVIPVIGHVVSVYRNRLSALDTTMIIGGIENSDVPRFFYSNLIDKVDDMYLQIKRRIMYIVYIKS
jgi:hypothetical protein